jgi:uncharacterized protein (DUF1501 family)
MRAAADLLHDGRLAIVQGVGYPNPNRSHFESMAVWQTARFAADEQRGSGWIGAALDERARPAAGGPDAVYVGEGEMPRALIGRRTVTSSLSRPDDLVVRLSPVMGNAGPSPAPADDVAAFVRQQVLSATGSAHQLADAAREGAGTASAAYPDSRLAYQLSLVARLIKSGGSTRVYYVTQPGYDTHALQLDQHADLLGDLSRSLKAFLDDLRDARLEDRVLVMSFSEFGRRVAENSSRGTDHGAAGPVLLAGTGVRAGLHGTMSDLDDRPDGDVHMSVDFRTVYAAVLRDWLGVKSDLALHGAFEPLPLVLNPTA